MRNQLTTLPESLLKRGRGFFVNFENNPIPLEEAKRLENLARKHGVPTGSAVLILAEETTSQQTPGTRVTPSAASRPDALGTQHNTAAYCSVM